ncbi:MAG TPA: hypothetical protein VKM54_29505 [Myxococcota bacterium]|nr:hypothetical protein [Myxococcota bacterium]
MDRLQQRQRIRELLASMAEPLLALYLAALRLLETEAFPAKAPLIAHCVREVANRLPAYLDEIPSGRFQHTEELNALLAAWRAEGLPVGDESLPASLDGEMGEPRPSVQIPTGLIRIVASLLGRHEAAGRRARAQREALFSPRDSRLKSEQIHNQEPTIQIWIRLNKWFMQHVHHSPERAARSPVEQANREFVSKFEQFEDLLYAALAPLTDLMSSLDEDLENANR